jgi:hypothetical protein
MKKSVTCTLLIVTVLIVMSRAANAQSSTQTPWQQQKPAQEMSLAGPRMGVTFLDDGVRADLAERGIDVGFGISQFGWQKEKRFLSSDSGWTGVTEFVFLLGGFDQGVVLPSLNWLVGARTSTGVEFAVGPNVTGAGVALAIAGGVTFRTGNLNIPVNVAMVPSRSGTRVSLLAGFNMRKH